MLLDIDHLQLAMPVGAEQRGRAFYGGVLGLQEIEKPAALRKRGGLWFRIGARQLHLGVEAAFRPAQKAHPAFLVDDVAALANVLRSHGHAVVTGEALPGCVRIYADDPFGNRLEFLQPL